MTRASEARAHAVFRHVFPDATVIEVIPNRSNMTDTIDTAIPEDNAWAEATGAPSVLPVVSYPENPVNPHNHAFTLSLAPDKAPFLVIRASSTQELLGTMDALEADGVYAAMGAAQATVRAHAEMGRGPVPTAPVAAPQAPAQGVPQGPGAPANAFNPQGHFNVPQGNQPPPFGPNVSVPGAPGFVGAPAAPAWGGGQQAQGAFGGAPARTGPKPRPDWPQVFKISVPMPQKDAFKAFREQNKEILKGKVAWSGGGDYWIHGDVVQGFAAYTPVPA